MRTILNLKLLMTVAFIVASVFNLEAQNIQVASSTSNPPQRNVQYDLSKLFNVDATHEYEYSEEMVDGGDGYKLLTRIYLPKGVGPWPVIVTRTPYVFGGRGDTNVLGREYAKRGIGYIQQDCRGKGGSEGFFKPNIYERADGIALYQWIAVQPWCKVIGIFGSSYTALTGWLVADSVPDKVKGFYLQHYGVDRHISCYRAGLFREDIMSGWAVDNAEEKINKPQRQEGQQAGENYYEFYRHLPTVEADEAILGTKLPWYRDWITHTDYNDPYWNSGVWADLKNVTPQVSVPVTIVAGQFDHHEEGTILGYERLNDKVKSQSRLILGSWNHSFQTTPTHVPTEHAKDYNTITDMFEWFYSILVKEIVPDGEIKVYAIEEDKWVNLDEWPIKPIEKKEFFFTNEENKDGNAYLLSDKKQKENDVISYNYDPLNPVMAVGGETLFTSALKRGSQLQPEPGYRDDVISFISEPLTEDLVIGGNVVVNLSVSTNVDDTSFAFTLSEICPNGETYNIRTSITTLGYRNDIWGDRQTYVPNQMVDIEIVSLPIVWNVKAGNCLRIDIKSSNFPEYAIHSNYAGVWSEQPKTRVAEQKIYVGKKSASNVVFPIMNLQ